MMTFADLQGRIAYLRPQELLKVSEAYEFAALAHDTQTRQSGDPYIIHPLEVASIISELHLDSDTLCAALLHDVVEDTAVTAAELKERFGEQIAEIVVGLTKLSKVSFQYVAEHQAENYRRFFIATARDPRVVVIKLADRVHNMRTLDHMPLAKQQAIAQETLHIYAPLAGRCGIQLLKAELEDLSLKYLHPDIYQFLYKEIELHRESLQSRLNSYVMIFEQRLQEAGIEAAVYGRIKHFYSIYRKMTGQRVPLSEVFDLLAVRIVTKDVTSCYAALGIAHNIGTMISSRFKDFISLPKSNGYQSLHTTIVFNERQNLEVQIRTEEMHDLAELGVATHWAYKEKQKPSASSLELVRWMRELIEELGQEADPVDYVEELKTGALDDEIRIFTPKFDLVTLPRDSTPIDFAYRVHTEVGHRCIGAKINNRIAPLDTPLENGDIVEILTSKQPRGPSLDWLSFVKSRTAKDRIRSWLRQERREENMAEGEASLLHEIRKLGYDPVLLMHQNELEVLIQRYNKQTWDDILAAIGFGELSAHTLAVSLAEAYRKTIPVELPSAEELLEGVKAQPGKSSGGIVIDDLDGLVYRLARCCNPLPGEPIVGYVTRGRGVTIHRQNCAAAHTNEPERLIAASWGEKLLHSFAAPLQVSALNRPNLLQQVLLQIQDMRVTLHSVNARGSKSGVATIDMLLEVASMEQLMQVAERLRRMKDVYAVDLPGNRTFTQFKTAEKRAETR